MPKNGEITTDQYDSVYEFRGPSERHAGAWWFIGKLNGRTVDKFISDRENQFYIDEMDRYGAEGMREVADD